MNKILENSWILDLKNIEEAQSGRFESAPIRDPVFIEEFGSSQPVRFLTLNKESKTTECLDCDAQALWSELNSLEITAANALSSMKKLQECLLFVLENVDWPVGN